MQTMSLIKNRYAIGKRIGKGNMGIVYDGEDTLLKRRIVIKESHKDLIINEVQAMVHLSGRYTTLLLDSALEEERGYLMMLPISGHHLGYYEKRHICLENRRLRVLLLDWLQGLHELHKGHVHGDIAPEQLWISQEGRGIIMDFGSAFEIGGESPGEMLSHVATLAPEVIKGYTYTDKADVYAFCHSVLSVIDQYALESQSICHLLRQGLNQLPQFRPTVKALIEELENL